MKKYFFSFLTLLLAFTFAQAQKFENSETRSLPSFRKIKSGSVIEVVLVQGMQESAKILAKNVALAEITTEVRGGELCLELDYKNQRRNITVRIEVTYKQLDAIKISGAGSLTAEGVVKSENLTIKLSGAGNINLPIEAKKLIADISGAGNIKINGKTDYQEVTVNGAGEYKGYDLASLNTTTRISGAGNVAITVTGTLEGRISGAGNLHYKGKPQHKNIESSGAGSASAVE